MKLTVSFVKGNKHESSVYHNNRSIENNFDYNKKGHKHIRKEETKNNKVLIHRDIEHIYDLLFYKTIQKYNAKNKKKHAERCFDGQTEVEKLASIAMYQQLHAFLKQNKTEQKQSLERLRKDDDAEIADFFEKNKSMKLSDARHKLTEAKHAKTFGQVMHDKMKHDKTTIPQVEFIMQVGNAADFNLTDDKGFFLGKDGKRIKNDEGKEVNINSSADDIEKITPKMVRKNKKLWEQANTILEKSLKDFQKRNKHFVVYNAVIHNDEATPHMHFNAIPLATGYKRGLENRVSINKALSNEGYEYSKEDNRKQFTDFQHAQADAIAKIMKNETGITRKAGVTNNIKNIHEYKKVQNAVASEKENLENVQKQVKQQDEKLTKQVNIYKSNKKVLDTQNAKISSNKKLLDSYGTSITKAQKALKSVKNEQIKAEEAKNKAVQEKENNQKQIDEQHKRINKQVAIYQDNKKVLTAQNAKISSNKKLLNDYDTSIVKAQKALETAENERQEAEANKEATITNIKNEGLAQAKKAQESFVQRLIAKQNELDKREKKLAEQRKKQLEHDKKIKEREKKLAERENMFEKTKKNFFLAFRRAYISYGVQENYAELSRKHNDKTLQHVIDAFTNRNMNIDYDQLENEVFLGTPTQKPYTRFKAFAHATKQVMTSGFDSIFNKMNEADKTLSPQVKNEIKRKQQNLNNDLYK